MAYLVGAIGLAAGAGFLAWWRYSTLVPETAAWVAARDIPPGAVVTQQDLRQVTVSRGGLPEGAIRTAAEAVGKRVRYGITAGDYVRKSHFAEGAFGTRLAALGPEWRAMALPGDLAPGLIDRVDAGDWLEVVAVLPVQNQRENTQVAVVATRAVILEVIRPGGSDRGALLVAVPSQDVPRVALALRAGQVSLNVVPAAQGGQSQGWQGPYMLENLTGQAAQAGRQATPGR